ncbi:MAG: hypothetical protein AABY15_02335, partial [Nanoarchaeota archaeon]
MQTEKLTISKIYISDKDKNGKPYVGKNGPFSRIGIKCKEYGDRWFGSFLNKISSNWKEGDVVEVETWEDVQYGWKFQTLSKLDLLERRVAMLESSIYPVHNQPEVGG